MSKIRKYGSSALKWGNRARSGVYGVGRGLAKDYYDDRRNYRRWQRSQNHQIIEYRDSSDYQKNNMMMYGALALGLYILTKKTTQAVSEIPTNMLKETTQIIDGGKEIIRDTLRDATNIYTETFDKNDDGTVTLDEVAYVGAEGVTSSIVGILDTGVKSIWGAATGARSGLGDYWDMSMDDKWKSSPFSNILNTFQKSNIVTGCSSSSSSSSSKTTYVATLKDGTKANIATGVSVSDFQKTYDNIKNLKASTSPASQKNYNIKVVPRDR